MLKLNLYHIELFFLFIFILSIPSFEGPKNVSWLFFIIIWFSNRYKYIFKHIDWSVWDSLFLTWILSTFLVAALGNQGQNEWHGTTDIVRYVCISWLIYKSDYTNKVKISIFIAIIASTIITLSYAYWKWKIAHIHNNLSLNSVGHVNHSAIYLAIVAGLSFSILIAYWKHFNTYIKLTLILSTVILIWGTLTTSARGAIFPLLFIFFPLNFILYRKASKKAIFSSFIIIFIVSTAAFYTDKDLSNDVISTFTERQIGQRNQTFNSSILVWLSSPYYGVGLENISYHLTRDNIKKLAIDTYGNFNSSRYYYGSHAHNLFTNTLAERGIIGTIPVMIVLFYWIYQLISYRPITASSSIEIAAWGGSLSAWTITFFGGLFNTTLHHEHGILAVMLLCVWISIYTKRFDQNSPLK